MTLRHYWSSDLDSVPRARAAVLPVCVSSLSFTVDNVSAQFLCVLHFSKKNSFPMEDSRMSSLVPRPTPQGGRVWEITLLGAVQLECHGFWIHQTSSFRSTRLVLYYSNFQNFYVLPYICFLSLVELERWLAGLTFFPSSTQPAAFRPSSHFRA